MLVKKFKTSKGHNIDKDKISDESDDMGDEDFMKQFEANNSPKKRNILKTSDILDENISEDENEDELVKLICNPKKLVSNTPESDKDSSQSSRSTNKKRKYSYKNKTK
eukprot:UN00078